MISAAGVGKWKTMVNRTKNMTTPPRGMRGDDAPGPRFDGAPERLEVLLAYEDAGTGRRGKLALDRVLNQTDATDNCNCRYHLWRLDLLCDSGCRAEADRIGRVADIVAVSIHTNTRMETESVSSLTRWIGCQRPRPCVLVISLDDTGQPSAGLDQQLARLRAAAENSGWTVLFHHGEAPCPESDAIINAIRHRANDMSSVLAHILEQPDSRQGPKTPG